jgi:porphobilinogen deaminase
MQTQQLDGLVLAAAGLIRLGKTQRITQYLEPEQMIPAPTQGTLAIELHRDNEILRAKLDALSDEKTQCETAAERAFLQGIGGDCHLPIGAYAEQQPDGQLHFLALYGDAELKQVRRCELRGTDPYAVAAEAVRSLET